MRPFVLSVAAVCAFAIVTIGPEITRADDKKSDEMYTIQVAKFVPKGKSVRCTDKADVSSRVKVSDDQGTALSDKKTVKTSLRVYVEKTLAVNEKDGKRAKYTRTYEKAKDIENDESESKPYQGRTILLEEAGGKWKLSAEGKPALGKADLSELSGEVNKSANKDEAVLYSKKPIGVGEKWTPVGKDVAKFFAELNMDPASVKAQGKLTKAYKKAGRQWGTVELVITFDADLGEIKKAKGEIKATIDEVIDGSSTAGKATFEVTIIAKQTLEKDCKKYVVDYAVSATIRAERADEE